MEINIIFILIYLLIQIIGLGLATQLENIYERLTVLSCALLIIIFPVSTIIILVLFLILSIIDCILNSIVWVLKKTKIDKLFIK